MIDRVEEEVAKAVDYVDSGNKELVEAGKKRRKVRKVGNVMFVTSATFISFVVVAVVN